MRFWVVALSLLVSCNAVAAKLNVVTTLPFLADIAKKVGGEFIDAGSLAQPNQDPHFVIPVPTLMKKTRDADVFIEIGLELEIWAPKVIDGSGNTRIQSGKPGRIVASKGIATEEVPSQMSRALGDIHPGGNPHVWLDPLNAKIIARNICDGLSKVDAAHAADYKKGLAAFEAEIDKRMVVWKQTAADIKNKQFITYHKSFVYFAKRFGFTIPMEIEEKPGITPSARHRDDLIAFMNKDKIDAIMMELYYDRTPADFIAGKTNARVIQVPIDVGADPAAKDYFSLIDLLLARLKK